MTYKHRVMVYGRRHIHDHVRALAEWRKRKNNNHSISEEYDRLLIAGVKALYGQDLQLNLAPKPEELGTPPAPQVASNA